MSKELMREEFESWIRDNVYTGALLQTESGGYRDHVVQPLWLSWQASRAAVVVELPHQRAFTCYWTHRESYHYDDVLLAIESAGLKVAP